MKRPALARRPGPRGFAGTGAGTSTFIQPAPLWRGTTRQVCGLWPFAVGAGSPNVGVPLGRNLNTGEMVCCDPVSWFQRASLISNPSAFIEAIPGIGKTTLVQKQLVGLAAYGVLPVVLGDIRPDYTDVIRAMGGQVIRIGGGTGHLNPLDTGEAEGAAARLTGAARIEVLTDAASRRRLRIETLVKLSRHADPTDRERNILARALDVLDDRHAGTPLLEDLLAVIREAPEPVRAVALDRGDMDKYREITDGLEATMIGLASGARFGDMFSRPTDEPMSMNRPVVFDVSQLRSADEDTQAAALAMCWSAGYGNIGAAQVLADEGVIARQHYIVVTDELHRVLRAGGGGMVEVVDQTTRLNRTDGTGNIQITHSMSDLESLAREEDRKKAIGFVERAGMVICGGLPAREMEMLTKVVTLSDEEQQTLTAWSAPGAWNRDLGRLEAPPGRGKFLIKVGNRPGIPFQVQLTPSERSLGNSNRRWVDASRQSGATS